MEGRLTVAGQHIPYRLRRRRGARRLILRLSDHGEAIVSLPWQCPFDEGLAFLRRHETWLRQRLEQRATLPSLTAWLADDACLALKGDDYRVVLSPTTGSAYHLVDEPRRTVLLAYTEPAEPSLRALLRALAKKTLTERTARLAATGGFEVRRVTVRNQRRRWGSCSSAASLSLNWRLILLPARLCDHILWHELAHLRHPNHSPSFWNFLRQLDPATDRHRAEIRALESKILPLGALHDSASLHAHALSPPPS